MAKFIGKKNASLSRILERRLLSERVEEEKRKKEESLLFPYLPKDCLSNILVRLPLDSLPRTRFVCKPWYNIINSRTFIDEHFSRSESVLLFLSPIPREILYPSSVTLLPPEKPNTFSAEVNLQPGPIPIFDRSVINSKRQFYIKFMEFKDGKGKIGEFNVSCLGNIRATCNGLVLLDNKMKKGGLVIINPVTRKLMALPLGTIYPPHSESYGFALNDLTGEYKVVHLFRDELGYISCEILNPETKLWREVNGPSFGLFGWLECRPVSAIGALHWVPQIDHSDYLVSMEVDSERFHTVQLPKTGRTYDGIVERGGVLCFITHEELQIDIYILKSLHGEVWTKNHTIRFGCVMDMVPLFSLRIKGEIIFKRDEDGSLYAYDFQLQTMRKVEMEKGVVFSYDRCGPHINSLVSWSSRKPGRDMGD